MIYSVTLEKTNSIFGRSEPGTRVRKVTRRGWATEAEARERAYRILTRDAPDENGMDWEVVEMTAEEEVDGATVCLLWSEGTWSRWDVAA